MSVAATSPGQPAPVVDLRQPLIEGEPKDVQADWRQHSLIQVIYKIIVLAPKYIGFGIGWAAGFVCGGIVGAGIGAGVGAFAGSMVSLGIEMLVGKYGGFDSQLRTVTWDTLVAKRCKSALVFSVGCLAAGLALPFFSGLVKNHLLSAVITYFGVGVSYFLGATGARCIGNMLDSGDDKGKMFWQNMCQDCSTAVGLIGPAAMAFSLLHPVLVTSWSSLLHKHAWQVVGESDKAMLIGVAPGAFLSGCAYAILNNYRKKRHLKADPAFIQPGSPIQAQDSPQQQPSCCGLADYPEYSSQTNGQVLPPTQDGSASVVADAVLDVDGQPRTEEAVWRTHYYTLYDEEYQGDWSPASPVL